MADSFDYLDGELKDAFRAVREGLEVKFNDSSGTTETGDLTLPVLIAGLYALERATSPLILQRSRIAVRFAQARHLCWVIKASRTELERIYAEHGR